MACSLAMTFIIAFSSDLLCNSQLLDLVFQMQLLVSWSISSLTDLCITSLTGCPYRRIKKYQPGQSEVSVVLVGFSITDYIDCSLFSLHIFNIITVHNQLFKCKYYKTNVGEEPRTICHSYIWCLVFLRVSILSWRYTLCGNHNLVCLGGSRRFWLCLMCHSQTLPLTCGTVRRNSCSALQQSVFTFSIFLISLWTLNSSESCEASLPEHN